MIFIAASWLLAMGGTWLGWWVALAYTMQTAPQGLPPGDMALGLALPAGSVLTGVAALYQYWGTDAAWWRFALLAPPMLLSGAIIALFASEGRRRARSFRPTGAKPRPRRPASRNSK